MPEFGATITLQVVYRAQETELTTGDRAHALAETMLAVLRGSAKVKGVETQRKAVSLLPPKDSPTRTAFEARLAQFEADGSGS